MCSVHQCIATCSGVLQCAVCRTVVIVHEVAAALCTWHLDLRDTDAVNCKFSSQPSSINILVINVDYYLCILTQSPLRTLLCIFRCVVVANDSSQWLQWKQPLHLASWSELQWCGQAWYWSCQLKIFIKAVIYHYPGCHHHCVLSCASLDVWQLQIIHHNDYIKRKHASKMSIVNFPFIRLSRAFLSPRFLHAPLLYKFYPFLSLSTLN